LPETEEARPYTDGRQSETLWNPPHPQPLSHVGERGAEFLAEFEFFHSPRGVVENSPLLTRGDLRGFVLDLYH